MGQTVVVRDAMQRGQVRPGLRLERRPRSERTALHDLIPRIERPDDQGAIGQAQQPAGAGAGYAGAEEAAQDRVLREDGHREAGKLKHAAPLPASS